MLDAPAWRCRISLSLSLSSPSGLAAESSLWARLRRVGLVFAGGGFPAGLIGVAASCEAGAGVGVLKERAGMGAGVGGGW
jgi:hypothetical protein